MSSTVQKALLGRLQSNRDKMVIYHGQTSAFNTSSSLPQRVLMSFERLRQRGSLGSQTAVEASAALRPVRGR